MAPSDAAPLRTRREPPAFATATVTEVHPLRGSMVRIRLELDNGGIDRFDPASSIRVLLPRDGADQLEMPQWNGNEFRFDDGTRPPIRTLTPVPVDGSVGGRRLDICVLIHDGNHPERPAPLSEWAAAVRPGGRVAVSGPGRGFALDGVRRLLLVGDGSAVPAIGTILAAIDTADPVPVDATIEVIDPLDPPPLDPPPLDPPSLGSPSQDPGVSALRWLHADRSDPGAALVEWLRSAPIPEGTHVWAAGEAAAMHQIRRHLFDERGLARRDATVRGYWKRFRGRGRPRSARSG